MKVLGPTDAEFGVVIFTPSHVMRLTRAACASIRYFMGDTPICVFVDGRHPATDLKRAGVRVEHVRGIEDRDLRSLCTRTARAKMASLWVAPYKRFLYIDSDAVVWGDMREYLPDLDRFDFVLDGPHPTHDAAEHTRRYVMDVEAVERRFPDFDARRHIDDYVNTGVFFARRGAIDLDEGLAAMRLNTPPGEILRAWDQGILNFLLFRAADAGRIRLRQRQLQVLAFSVKAEELRRRFPLPDGRPSVVGEPCVLHWAASGKPVLRDDRGRHFAAATFFRREYRRQRRLGGSRATDGVRLRVEDAVSSLAEGRVAVLLRTQRRRVRLALGLRIRALLR